MQADTVLWLWVTTVFSCGAFNICHIGWAVRVCYVCSPIKKALAWDVFCPAENIHFRPATSVLELWSHSSTKLISSWKSWYTQAADRLVINSRWKPNELIVLTSRTPHIINTFTVTTSLATQGLPIAKIEDVTNGQEERAMEEIPQLTPELEEEAQQELGETPETRIKCLKQLREMLVKEMENGLRPRQDTPFLLRWVTCLLTNYGVLWLTHETSNYLARLAFLDFTTITDHMTPR